MRFQRLENSIAVCKQHLDASGERGCEIESYLVGYLLVIICSEFEIHLKKLLETRAARPGDAHLCNFVKHASGRIVRSIKIGEIAGTLGAFGGTYKDTFHAVIDNTQAAVAYNNIMTNRHLVAHQTGTQMTFAELEIEFSESCNVLAAIETALALTAAEIALLS